MSSISLVQAAVVGALALMGAFLGAMLARKSDYEKWYRQERSNAFGEFLRQLHDTRLVASDAYYSDEGSELSKSMKATEAFARLEKYTGIARLYMSAAGRAAMAEFTKSLWINCTTKGGPANRVTQIKEMMAAIQVLLEAELGKVPPRLRWGF